MKAVALGGGHGLYNTLTALRYLTPEVTAVVTVADDGGSSGRLRHELGRIPPGDLRMALAALLSAPAALEARGAVDPASADRARMWADLLQHRFGGSGALAGHPIGNLLLSGVDERCDDIVAALDALVDLFGIDGRVLPMATEPLVIEADVTGLEEDPRMSRVIRGQVAVATTPGVVRRVRVTPAEPSSCTQAVEAIGAADLVTLGPGSWFSSVIPHVLVPEQLAALRATPARKVLVVNLANEPGETTGFSVERHLHVLAAHAGGSLRCDDILVDAASVPAGREREHLERAAGEFGARLVIADLGLPGQDVHDPVKVSVTLGALLHDRR
ncbi:uridine diphosphate-N-acetylglucosamine-binding protein YvcK [Gordonia sp. PP30]|uniref:gluconeogenesis factor YvcK family protein n=1 Tax=unclassified Gordonia (in: high G+C Gram-positive bacteria) TaxID=2657482 RepID=UPI001FFF9712|nr:uridine diphosphate-N-acetylglucosamine-binding protein YvcK [Gordonia sp. PP30]UQE73190.1 uridine diphosphate-N-acetylglucosamine-binding protein YvcK [Gordonia sp. PP30]